MTSRIAPPAVQTDRLVARRVAALERLRPHTPAQLHRFVHHVLDLNVPRYALTPDHASPFDYLTHAFFEPPERSAVAIQDSVVWACRGGGKTLMGAVATLLDLLFKPGIQVRILGGSLEQSSKMYEHLLALCDRPTIRNLVDGKPTQRNIRLINTSHAAILAQSQRSVRGVRVQKLRCDEVEEFDRNVWAAAQLVTRSARCGQTFVHGRVEALSTMHRPFGLMTQLTDQSQERSSHLRILRWNYLDVIERCPPERDCNQCVLEPDCNGRAKNASGFMRVDDLVAQWHRTSRDGWAAEMACARPRRSDSVYPNFDAALHVCEPPPEILTGDGALLVGGMDFGLRSPLVMLWGVARGEHLHITQEYIESGRTLEDHLRWLSEHGPADRPLAWIAVDPAGKQRNSHTGVSDIDLLRERGYRVRHLTSRIRDGIERIRRRLDKQTLTISPRCVRLIEAMQQYHFDINHPERDEPVKDGPDHACDALRYLVVNLERGSSKPTVTRWA